MRIKHLPWIISVFAIMLFSGYTILYPTGAPAAKTGSPGDGANCTECHGGTATTTTGQITSSIPEAGYVPGTTYQITATNPLTNAGKMGFQVSPQNASGTLLGTLIAGPGSQLVGSNKYVTHVDANTTTSSWTFGWIAPAAGTGTVTFYGAFARNKPGPVTKSTLVVQEAISTGIADNQDFANMVTGGTNGSITVVLNTNTKKTKVSVFDLSGRQLLSTSVSGGGSHQLDQTFKTGVYIVVIQADNAVFKKKIMVIG